MLDSIIKVLDEYNVDYEFNGEELILRAAHYRYLISHTNIKMDNEFGKPVFDKPYNHIIIISNLICFWDCDEYIRGFYTQEFEKKKPMISMLDVINNHFIRAGYKTRMSSCQNRKHIIVSTNSLSHTISETRIITVDDSFNEVLDTEYNRVAFADDSIQFYNGDNHVWTIFNDDLRIVPA